MSKRVAEEPPTGGLEPPAKKIVFEPLQLGSISNLEELDLKTLQFQNRKLGQRLNQKNRVEEQLRERIDQLEKRQTQDDAVINVINRYWNQLNEDIRILLQRFDAETGDELETAGESEATTSFLTALSTWHKQELDEKLASRVQVSQRAVAKIIQVFDHLLQRNEKVSRALRGEKEASTAGQNETSGENAEAAPEPSTTEEQTPDSQSGGEKEEVWSTVGSGEGDPLLGQVHRQQQDGEADGDSVLHPAPCPGLHRPLQDGHDRVLQARHGGQVAREIH